jgi:hypothetical protein
VLSDCEGVSGALSLGERRSVSIREEGAGPLPIRSGRSRAW